MEPLYVLLPLHKEEEYEYFASLEGNTYFFHFYYNMRMSTWFMDISYGDMTPLFLGIALVPNFPILFDHTSPFTGYFWLDPIGEEVNETVSNPFELHKYFNLFYIYEGEL